MAKVALPSSAAVPVGTLPASLVVGLGSVAGLTSRGSRDLEGRQGRMDGSTLSADPHRSVGSSLIADLPLLAKAPQLEQFVDRPRLEPLLAELKPLKRQVDQLQAEAQVRWEKARQGAEGRAFGLRLLFVGPLLALAIWQFRRFRGTDQWPFASACTAAC